MFKTYPNKTQKKRSQESLENTWLYHELLKKEEWWTVEDFRLESTRNKTKKSMKKVEIARVVQALLQLVRK